MHKLSFLIVDDASFIRDLVKRTLKRQFAQCDIDEAINGKKAQALLHKRHYDLVLCDWEMPELSGLDVLAWLREHEQEMGHEKTPFMMVTSRGEKEHVVKAVQAGVSDYIGKPFSSDQLLKKVMKLLSINHKELIRAILKGTSTMQQPKPPTANDSASLLTAGSVSSKLVGKAPVKKSATAKATLQKVALRSPSSQWVGDLKDINLTDASLVITIAEGKPPSVLEQVVIDIATKKLPDRVARLNTFITLVSLQEKSLDCQRATVSLRVVDDDPDKLEILSHFIAEVR